MSNPWNIISKLFCCDINSFMEGYMSINFNFISLSLGDKGMLLIFSIFINL